MVWLVEVSCYIIIHVSYSDSLKVCLESIHESIHRLAYVLHSAMSAFNAIDQVTALTSDILLARIFPGRIVALYSTCLVKKRAVCAHFAFAFISSFAVGDVSVFGVFLGWDFSID